MDAQNLIQELNAQENKKQASILQKFFKTGKGEYGEGDIFLGIKIPVIREIAKNYYELDLSEIQKLLDSKINEIRTVGIIILTKKYQIAKKQKDALQVQTIVRFYLDNTRNINTWGLVDISAPKILGEYLVDKKSERNVLYELAISEKKGYNGFLWLWEKRIAIISTLAFIREKDFNDTLRLSKMFLIEEHDLMHKAVGWMLREMGKKEEAPLIDFLDENGRNMPRTMLRYAIEQLDEKVRQHYLKSTK
mgnify:CR=1 FL=1|jgi:3-methyladenine DNA glycosylase AlkD